MSIDLKILYRGPLSSCNYDCYYCPFAKHFESAEKLNKDRLALNRFTDWLKRQNEVEPDNRFSILFTPWGEGLTRRWYRTALIELTRLRNVCKVAIQTNISCNVDWIADCNLDCLGLWCTWHPSQISRAKFVDKCNALNRLGVKYSVGMVGIRDYMEDVERLRVELSDEVYFWVNAYKDVADYYTKEEVEFWQQIDPLFHINNRRHPSLGQECRAGESVISVDGNGDIRRCHFIKPPIGNLYRDDWKECLRPRLCTNTTCGCHIGYVHMKSLKLYELFGPGVLERIPHSPVWQKR